MRKHYLLFLTGVITALILSGCGGSGSATGSTSTGGSSGGSSGGSGGSSGNTFTVGGIVSGLPSGGVVELLDNGGNSQTVGNGAFTFTVSQGSNNVITTNFQATQSCIVTNGSALNVTANVNNINVACSPSTEKVLFSFSQNGPGGFNPNSSLLVDKAGNFYGDTAEGGDSNLGAVFFSTPDGKVSTLYSFKGGTGDGANPIQIIWAANGDILGITNAGGKFGLGVLFDIKIGANGSATETVLYNFGQNAPTGTVVSPASIVQGKDGFIYAVVGFGGNNPACSSNNFADATCASNGFGELDKIDLAGNETQLYSFGDGGKPGDLQQPSYLIQGKDGNLYGTAFRGGANGSTVCRTAPATTSCGYGGVFEYNLTTNQESVVVSLGSSADDGRIPYLLLQATNGNFYGLAGGGADGGGVVFAIDTANGNKESVLHAFGDPSVATNPEGPTGLIQASDGNLVVITELGGDAAVTVEPGFTTGGGALGEIALPSGTYTNLYNYGTNGGESDGLLPLAIAQDGNGLVVLTLYGGTGGINDFFGTITTWGVIGN